MWGSLARRENRPREETRRKRRKIRKKERKTRKPILSYHENPTKPMILQDFLVLSLRRMKEEEERKEKQGNQARKWNW